MTKFTDDGKFCFEHRVAGGLAAMSHDDEPPDWFIELWLTASDGDASDEDLIRFNQLIEQDATARCNLLDLAQLHAWLEWLRNRMECQ